jgi:hypothetical protein
MSEGASLLVIANCKKASAPPALMHRACQFLWASTDVPRRFAKHAKQQRCPSLSTQKDNRQCARTLQKVKSKSLVFLLIGEGSSLFLVPNGSFSLITVVSGFFFFVFFCLLFQPCN